jgi:hypothetical protein
VDEIINSAIFGEQSGLELRSWIVTNNTDAIESAVQPYLMQSVPLDAASLDQLRLAGLRLIAIPIDEVLALRSRMPIAGQIGRQWIGEAPAWTNAVTSPRFANGKTVRVSGELAQLRAGSLRLLTRTWTAPSPAGATVRIDLALQHVATRNLDPRLPSLELTLSQRSATSGMVFESTIAQLTADGRYAFVIIPEKPETVWTPLSGNADTTNDSEQAPDSDKSQPSGEGPESAEHEAWTPAFTVEPNLIQGPPSMDIPTVGEATLIEPQREPGAGQRRAIIVLIPHVPAAIRLLP